MTIPAQRRIPPALRTWGVIPVLVALPLLTLSGCGSSGGSESWTPEQICALVSTTEMGDLVGTANVTAEAGTASAPSSCVYAYTRPVGLEGTANIFVSVLTGSRTGNATGSQALAHVAGEAGAQDAPALNGVNTENFTTSGGFGPMVAAVDAHGRIATVLLDSALTEEQRAAVTNAVLDALATIE